MNPFENQLNSSNNELFACLSKLRKKSLLTKMKALECLLNNFSEYDFVSNLNDVLYSLSTTFYLEDKKIVTATEKLLLKIFDITIEPSFSSILKEYLPEIIIFCINNTFITQLKKRIRKKHIVDSQHILFDKIDFEADESKKYSMSISKILILQNLKVNEIITEVINESDVFNLNDLNDIEFIEFLINEIKDLEQQNNVINIFKEKINKVENPLCLNKKWDIKIKINSEFELALLNKDIKYLKNQNFKLILDFIESNSLFDFEFIQVNNVEKLYIIKDYLKNVEPYIIEYINNRTIRSSLHFNLFDFVSDLEEIHKKCTSNNLNIILEYMYKNKMITKEDAKKCLNDLNGLEKLKRSYILNINCDIELNTIDIKQFLKESLTILPKNRFENLEDFNIEEKVMICCQYPDLINVNMFPELLKEKKLLQRILPILNNEILIEEIKRILKITYKPKDYYIVYYDTEQTQGGCKNDKNILNTNKSIELLFYYNIYDICPFDIKKISAFDIINEYLDINFVVHLLENELLDLGEFISLFYEHVNVVDLPNIIDFDDDYYLLVQYFHKNIQTYEFDQNLYNLLLNLYQIIKQIEPFYLEKDNHINSLYFLIDFLEEILNLEKTKSKDITFTLELKSNIKKINGYFGGKIIIDNYIENNLEYEEVKHLLKQLEYKNTPCFKEDEIIEILNFFDNINIENVKIEKNYFAKMNTNDLIEHPCRLLQYLRFKNEINQEILVKNFHLMNERCKNRTINHFITNNIDFKISFKDVFIVRNDNVNTEESKYLNIENISNITTKNLKSLMLFNWDVKDNTNNILEFIEGDILWKRNNPKCKERYKYMTNLIILIVNEIKYQLVNIYSLAKHEYKVDKNVLFYVMTESFSLEQRMMSEYKLFAWEIILRIVYEIRAIDLCFFIEKAIKGYNYESFLKETYFDDQKKLFSFNFPSLFPKMNGLEDMIKKELTHKTYQVETKLVKSTNGFLLLANYTYDDASISAEIDIVTLDSSKSTFFSEIISKDQMLAMLNTYTRKSRKYMEIISLWKVNLDNKLSGTEECMICYFVIQIIDKTTPESTCSHCLNKFHSRCIQKWLISNERKACPLCQNRFK